MTFSMNIHPRKKWVRIDISLYGQGQGNCINLDVEDEIGARSSFSFHYKYEENASEFVAMLKEAVNKL